MVVFTCGHCGESVQKPKVEKHYLTKCRNRNPNLSCMDCFKDFLGTDYESHTKCITEEERYSGKGFMAKEKKGEKKQTAWVEMVQSVLDEQKNLTGNVRRIIETVSKHNNTPRKKPKFVNFVKNVCGHKTNVSDIDQAWDLISVKLSELSNAQNKNQNQKKATAVTNGDTKVEKQNGITEADTTKEEDKVENGVHEVENGEHKEENEEVKPPEGEKKMSKKQRKEEKKRQKYEAELQSAVAAPVEEEEESQSKKDKKKKKNRTESQNGSVDENVVGEGKGKKKRKRQDTANSVPEVIENGNIENVENEPVIKEKSQKKKLKVGQVEPLDESVCLHDQNVALGEEEAPLKNGKFDWHAVILSVLEKKGNEVPFKRLQKKVLSEFSEMTGQDVDDRIADKFIKKLKSAPNVRVDKNRVLLLQ
ncbi:cell growth-regulating nucleolar protein [Amyelois transitella]|uniref:cell growth-regulating nucleolar protein n=1 Tax=Amyelois transitella TaxID=680683 RepID=UPI00067E3567|nr:cell growth-regulating nucleolar protein [Amyelois transitella]XP_013185096.1 cell growth-regulating nucleolar protein [Amyelois transitella]